MRRSRFTDEQIVSSLHEADKGSVGPLLTGRAATIDAIEKALVKAGVEFTNGDEPGVKLRAKRKR